MGLTPSDGTQFPLMTNRVRRVSPTGVCAPSHREADRLGPRGLVIRQGLSPDLGAAACGGCRVEPVGTAQRWTLPGARIGAGVKISPRPDERRSSAGQ